MPESNVFTKVLVALFILLMMIFISDFVLVNSGVDSNDALLMAVQIVTHVSVDSDNHSFLFVIMSIIGGVVQFYLIYVILEYVLEGKFKEIFSGVKFMNKIKKMKDHYIIAGGGRVGSHAAERLMKKSKNVIIVDNDEKEVNKLRKQGFFSVQGDVLDPHFLKEINIDKAKQLFACLGSDSDNILLVLTVRELNKDIRMSARASHDDIISKLKHAGAAYVVVPSSLGGEELARTAL